MRFKVISVDDDASSHEALRVLLRDVGDIELAATFTSPIQAAAELNRSSCDALFLDVAMAEMSGLELLRSLKEPPITVLLTAHVEYALAAFELGVRDYLLKPVSAARLHRCLENLRPLLYAARADVGVRAPARLAIKCGNGHQLFDPSAVVRIEAAGNFSIVHSDDRQVFASETMKELQRRLEPFGFVRIHKSHLVNVGFIRGMSATEISLKNGAALPVGRAYRATVAEAVA